MEHVVVLIARLTLGVIWVVAAVAKLTSPASSVDVVEAFGVLRGRVARALGFALPYVELVLGGLLIIGAQIRAAAMGSVVLLTAFSIAMAVNLIQGRTVRCNCFAQLGDEYVSWASVMRNAGLLVLSVVPLLVRSDYLALPRVMAGSLRHGAEPPLAVLPPILLMWLALLLGCGLTAAMWSAAMAMARAGGGPADELPETLWMRRVLGLDAVRPPLAHSQGD